MKFIKQLAGVLPALSAVTNALLPMRSRFVERSRTVPCNSMVG
ncbi:hypothetical protein [Chroococcidiopsis sp. TS-821]|nr:hypothetical protein [Chroococcidiopsis sp. TS-821]